MQFYINYLIKFSKIFVSNFLLNAYPNRNSDSATGTEILFVTDDCIDRLYFGWRGFADTIILAIF